MKYLYIVLFFLTGFIGLSAQETNYDILSIPTELIQNANAIVRNQKTNITVIANDAMKIEVNRTITVLNKAGNKAIDAFVHYDNNSKVVEIEAQVFDAYGKALEKFKKKDFVDVSAVDGFSLYSDSRIKYLEFTPVSYPYTLRFSYIVKTSSTGFLPNWSPLEGYLVATENNEYTIDLNYSKVRIKEKNFEGYEIEKSIEDNKIHYSVKNLSGVKKESLSPSIRSFKPVALIALNDFKSDGVVGSYTNWKEFGLWMNNALLKGRDIIDLETKNEVLSLVSGMTDPIKKAKKVYEYVQNKTRYISVQVGIGGIQPIAANEVDKMGYGDCKGLTNYTKALLNIVGVESYYSHIEANKNEPVSFEKDFASIEQGNHVILNIPNKGNDVWLECTSQSVPFGFLGTFTDDRDALVITPKGGIIKHTTVYKNEENLQQTKANIILNTDGDIKANLYRVSEGTQFDEKYDYEYLNEEDLIEEYKKNTWYYNNNLEIEKLEVFADKEKIEFNEDLVIQIKNYATINGNEVLFRVNVFNRNTFVPKRYRNRRLPLKINRGYKDVDEFTFQIPKEWKLDVLPETKEINTKFGSYKIQFDKINDHSFKYKKSIFIKEGLYSKEEYKLYRKFRKTISKYENLRIALNKN